MSKFDSAITPSLVGENSLIGQQKKREISGYTKPDFTFTNSWLKQGVEFGILTKAFSFAKDRPQNQPEAFTFKDGEALA